MTGGAVSHTGLSGGCGVVDDEPVDFLLFTKADVVFDSTLIVFDDAGADPAAADDDDDEGFVCSLSSSFVGDSGVFMSERTPVGELSCAVGGGGHGGGGGVLLNVDISGISGNMGLVDDVVEVDISGTGGNGCTAGLAA